MDQFDAMRIYVRVAETASFTRAAEGLGLPRASISSAIQRLESALGTRLLHRTTRRVQMTQDGQIYFDRCKDLLADLDELHSLFESGPAALHGRLRVDMPLGAARSLILPRLPEFLAEHPGIELELSSTDRHVDLVAEGFDCVLRVGNVADSRLVGRHLGHYRLINCASAAYLARHGTPMSLDALRTHRLIHYSTILGARPAGFEYRDVGTGERRSIAMAGSVTVNNSVAYTEACLAGLGIIQSPELGLLPELAAGTLVRILPDYEAAPLPVTLLHAHRRQVPRRVRAFMNWLAVLLQPQLLN